MAYCIDEAPIGMYVYYFPKQTLKKRLSLNP
jgi:hypothetical protein